MVLKGSYKLSWDPKNQLTTESVVISRDVSQLSIFWLLCAQSDTSLNRYFSHLYTLMIFLNLKRILGGGIVVQHRLSCSLIQFPANMTQVLGSDLTIAAFWGLNRCMEELSL